MTNFSSNIKAILWWTVEKIIEMESESGMPTIQDYDMVYWYELHIKPVVQKDEYDNEKKMPDTNILFITYRNSSNWYYWGWMEKIECDKIPEDTIEITKPFESYMI